MKIYYLKYDEKANINYYFLFALFCIAQTEKKESLDKIVCYTNLRSLSDEINSKCKYNISVSSISRILNNNIYNEYFTKCNGENKIILHTNI